MFYYPDPPILVFFFFSFFGVFLSFPRILGVPRSGKPLLLGVSFVCFFFFFLQRSKGCRVRVVMFHICSDLLSKSCAWKTFNKVFQGPRHSFAIPPTSCRVSRGPECLGKCIPENGGVLASVPGGGPNVSFEVIFALKVVLILQGYFSRPSKSTL